MTAFRNSRVPKNQVKLAHLLFLPENWQNSGKDTTFIRLNYRCANIAEKQELCFPFILEKNFKQKTKIDKGYPL